MIGSSLGLGFVIVDLLDKVGVEVWINGCDVKVVSDVVVKIG